MDKLSGYKTYICAGLLIVTGVLKYFNIIDESISNLIITTLLGSGALSLRHGISKTEDTNKN